MRLYKYLLISNVLIETTMNGLDLRHDSLPDQFKELYRGTYVVLRPEYREKLTKEGKTKEAVLRLSRTSIDDTSLFKEDVLISKEEIEEIKIDVHKKWELKYREYKDLNTIKKESDEIVKYIIENAKRAKMLMWSIRLNKNIDVDDYFNSRKFELTKPFYYNHYETKPENLESIKSYEDYEITSYEFISTSYEEFNNPIFCLQPSNKQEQLWFMGFKYPNFNYFDDNKDKYIAVVVVDEELIENIQIMTLETNEGRWNTDVDNKSTVKEQEDIGDYIVELLFEEDDLGLMTRSGIYKNLNKKRTFRTGGYLGLYSKDEKSNYIRLDDVITGKVNKFDKSYHIGHIFDCRRQSVVLFNTSFEEDQQREFEKSQGIIRGKKIESGLTGASRDVNKDILNNTTTKVNSMSGVFVIDTPEMLEQLYNHLTSDVYRNRITSASVAIKISSLPKIKRYELSDDRKGKRRIGKPREKNKNN